MTLPGKRWKYSDFGIAKDAGTKSYQGPEAKLDFYSHATDVYSLGRVFYELLAGRLPPTKNRTKWFKEFVYQHPVVGVASEKLIGSMLAEDPKGRPSAEAILAEIENLIQVSRLVIRSRIE